MWTNCSWVLDEIITDRPKGVGQHLLTDKGPANRR